jgi:hypothetical protein
MNIGHSNSVQAPDSAKAKTPARAVLLDSGGVATKRAAAFLTLLGIEWEEVAAKELVGRAKSENRSSDNGAACLLLSGEDVALLAQIAARQSVSLDQVAAPHSAVVLHSLSGDQAILRAVEELSATKLSVAEFSSNSRNYSVCSHHPECGPLAGLSFGPIDKATDKGLTVLSSDGTIEKIIEIDGAGLLTRICRPSQHVLISTATEIADLGETTSQKIDFRTSFSRILPLMLAQRIVFRDYCWLPQRYWANIIIDDPPLWMRYGHLNLRHLVSLTDRLGCACTIGMIPWNYRRSRQEIAELFAARAPKMGICYHGCNHTAAEFGIGDHAGLTRLAAIARQRMSWHERMTNLPCQPVMVFPQGVFSVEAMRCLHAAGYLAAVNTEVQDLQRHVRVTQAGLMQPALLCYDSFPLFSRRSPGDSIVNFAIDAFLGKPCLAVVHHEFFKRGFAAFEELVQSITSLHPQLAWSNLENIAMESSLIQVNSSGRSMIKIFSNQAIVRHDNSKSSITIVKPIGRSSTIDSIDVNGEPSEYIRTTADVRIPLTLESERSARISIRLATTSAGAFARDSIVERLRVAARRHACDFRDNYLARSETLTSSAQAFRQAVRRFHSQAASKRNQVDSRKTKARSELYK